MQLTRAFTAIALVLIAQNITSKAAAQSTELSPDVLEYVAVSAPSIALTHVRVIDGTGAAPMEDQTILIHDGMITEVGAAGSVTIPVGAEVLDLDGHTVIPGIVGLHDHTSVSYTHLRAHETDSYL